MSCRDCWLGFPNTQQVLQLLDGFLSVAGGLKSFWIYKNEQSEAPVVRRILVHIIYNYINTCRLYVYMSYMYLYVISYDIIFSIFCEMFPLYTSYLHISQSFVDFLRCSTNPTNPLHHLQILFAPHRPVLKQHEQRSPRHDHRGSCVGVQVRNLLSRGLISGGYVKLQEGSPIHTNHRN